MTCGFFGLFENKCPSFVTENQARQKCRDALLSMTPRVVFFDDGFSLVQILLLLALTPD